MHLDAPRAEADLADQLALHVRPVGVDRAEHDQVVVPLGRREPLSGVVAQHRKVDGKEHGARDTEPAHLPLEVGNGVRLAHTAPGQAAQGEVATETLHIRLGEVAVRVHVEVELPLDGQVVLGLGVLLPQVDAPPHHEGERQVRVYVDGWSHAVVHEHELPPAALEPWQAVEVESAVESAWEFRHWLRLVASTARC